MKKVLVSFSGGETSAYMINWLLLNEPNKEYKFVFANTGEENEETLIFVNEVSKFFNIDIIWLEYERSSFNIVNFETAYRSHNPIEIKNKWKNHPFRKHISHFGISNIQNNTCSRDMKKETIKRYMSSVGWKPSKYKTAIGIRADEMDRLGEYYYPLAEYNITKPIINKFWNSMPFRLNLKGYEGNCKTCWKKSDRKLVTIFRENPEKFEFFKQMEQEFEEFVKPERDKNKIAFPIRFFRESKTIKDIEQMSKNKKILNAIDDTQLINFQTSLLHNGKELEIIDISNGCEESCEAF
jgi:hypothetical protein